MEIKFSKKKAPLAITFVHADELNNSDPIQVAAQKRIEYSGKPGELFYFPVLDGQSALLVGLGKRDEVSLAAIRRACFDAAKLLRKQGEVLASIEVADIPSIEPSVVLEAMAEGFWQSTYAFESYLSEPKKMPELTILLTNPKLTKEVATTALDRAKTTMESVFLARDLVNEPSNVMYPETLALRAQKELEPLGVKVSIYDEKKIEKLGLKAFLSVAQGSDRPPRLIIMEYTGDPTSKQRTALVGKGLTYDSGGYSLKPSTSMKDMSTDMAGSATVIGALKLIASRKAKANVVGVVAACENLLSGKAYKPGDIIQSLSEKTIEVDNTDAEGRLTLADAVQYATNNLKCDRVIDIATLTGACLVALGEDFTALLTNNQAFADEVLAAAKDSDERVWQLPITEEFKKLNESTVADIKNTGGRFAGTITAGMFIKEFVFDDKPWVHLDIAGTAYRSKAQGYLPKGATGIHVKTLAALFE